MNGWLCERSAHLIEFELHIVIIFMLRKFPQFLRNRPNNNDDDEQTRREREAVAKFIREEVEYTRNWTT